MPIFSLNDPRYPSESPFSLLSRANALCILSLGGLGWVLVAFALDLRLTGGLLSLEKAFPVVFALRASLLEGRYVV